jgi:ribosomal small subunit protein bTHX
MGRGDRRTEKGKRWRKSYGNARPKPEKEKKEKNQDKKDSK